MSILHLMIGLPCSGKTTLAQQLEIELKALRLTPDEWHRHLFGQDATHPEHDERHKKIEELLWNIAASALKLGTDVILDFGLWTKCERDDFRERASILGATTIIHFLDIPHKELYARLDARNKRAPTDITYIPPSMLRDWISLFQAPDANELALNGKK